MYFFFFFDFVIVFYYYVCLGIGLNLDVMVKVLYYIWDVYFFGVLGVEIRNDRDLIYYYKGL